MKSQIKSLEELHHSKIQEYTKIISEKYQLIGDLQRKIDTYESDPNQN